MGRVRIRPPLEYRLVSAQSAAGGRKNRTDPADILFRYLRRNLAIRRLVSCVSVPVGDLMKHPSPIVFSGFEVVRYVGLVPRLQCERRLLATRWS